MEHRSQSARSAIARLALARAISITGGTAAFTALLFAVYERTGRSTLSPRLGINMGYAWVPIAAAEIGSRLMITSPTGPLSAEVVPLPFWDASKDVPKG